MMSVRKGFLGVWVGMMSWGLVLGSSLSYSAQETKLSLVEQVGRLPAPEIETLPNGLKIAWFTQDRLPLVDLVVLVRSGYRDDPAGKTGTAELVSNLLDRGAGGMSAQQIAKSVEMLGASRFASAEDDTFSVGVHGLSSDAPQLLDLLGKMVIRPDFPEVEVTREHSRILDRWSHVGDQGDSLVSLLYRRLISDGTSYSRGNFHSMEEFRRIGRSDVVGFHKKHFTAKNSLLMVVGQVNRASFKEKILASFGDWAGELPSREWKSYTDRRLPKKRGGVWVVNRPNLTQAQVRIGFRAPLFQAPEHYPLVVANAMLGEYFNSRLNSLIRDKLALTYSIGSGFAFSKDLASFTIVSATKNESVGQLIKKSVEVLKGLKRGPIPTEELQMAKDYLIGGFPLSTATLGAVASRWMSGYVFDLDPDYLNEFVPKVAKVSGGDVVSALGRGFDLDQMVIVVAGDTAEIIKSLKEAKLGPVQQVSLKDLL